MYDKIVPLGSRLAYPITITKLHKAEGDAVKKQEIVFEYSYSFKRESRKLEDNTLIDQKGYADFDCPAEGTIKAWRIKEGQVISSDKPCMVVEEACGHEVQMQGLCSLCGADMTEINWAAEERDMDRANINMTHDQTGLMVSQNVARRAEHETQKRLLKQRKLSLVVDLDQTIIHACVDNTVGEWQRDSSNPNYGSVKDIKSFQLQEDTNGFTYYIKQRPGLSEFLKEISKIYEMHVYTMGTRAYAKNVAEIVDPDKKFFGNRVISRDENGSLTAKSLQRLFPVSTDMVVIMDDRSDVWPLNRSNLIKVVPYDFYKGIGDINSSFLPKRTDMPSAPQSNGRLTTTESKAPPVDTASSNDEANLKDQVEEQEKTLEKQSSDRPLLQMQEELDKEDEHGEEEAGGSSSPGHRQTLLRDDDEELIALQDHLTDLHAAFYENYDKKRAERQEKEPHHTPGSSKQRRKSIDDGVDLSMVPDIGEILEEFKSDVLSGLVIVLSGLVPLGTKVEESEVGMQAQSFGAQVFDTVGPRVTHLVVSLERPRTKKVQQAAKIPSIRIVNQNWLTDCLSQWRRLDEGPYMMDVPESDRNRIEEDMEVVSEDDTATDTGLGNGLTNFDWDKADEELEEFMGDEELTSGEEEEAEPSSQESADTMGVDEDVETDSDTEDKPAEDSTQQGTKRKHEENDNADGTLGVESALAKKQRLARSRGASGLRSVTTGEQEEVGLPTPGPTGDEEVVDVEDFDDELARELEAELEAAGE